MRLQKIKANLKYWLLSLLLILLFAAPASSTPTLAPTLQPAATSGASILPTASPTFAPTSRPSLPTRAVTPERRSQLPVELGLEPADWRSWPVIPIVTQHVIEIYERGQALGNDPLAFSIFGDCQGVSELFLGPFATDPLLFASLPPQLQENVKLLEDSLVRSSPTTKPGTTSGALLWEEWHENKYGCAPNETPMDCELRLHNPSIVLIMVGTHWESRNEFYMRKILDALLERGIIPILSTKADNREGDHSINLQTAQLAAEYNIPIWNFWPVTAHLPNRGLYTKETDSQLGDIYLTEDALALHRFYALQTLDVVLRAVAEN